MPNVEEVIERLFLFITTIFLINASINLILALFSLARTIYDIWFYQNLMQAFIDYGLIQANVTKASF